MCLDPVSLSAAAAITSTASTVADVVSQQQAADAQQGYQQKLTAANNKVASRQISDIQRREAQETEAINRRREEVSLRSKADQATAAAIAAENGTGGNSVAALLREFRSQEGRFSEALTRERQLAGAEAAESIKSVRTGANFNNLRINRPIGQPNYLGAALEIGTNAIQFGKDLEAINGS